MHNPHRAGLWICLAVLVWAVVQAMVYAILVLAILPGGPLGLRLIGQGLMLVGVVVATVAYLGSALLQGRRSFRWVGFGLLVLVGVFLAGFAYWQTTWDFPNAISPEERARMRESCRQQLPWLLAWGTLNIVAGALLLLPPVGRFLRAQQETSRPNEPLQM
jgi:membrane protease YdiL (CAAX protease family)